MIVFDRVVSTYRPAIRRARKLIEQGFGWQKCVAPLRKLHHRGRELVSWVFTFTSAAYNLVRLRTLLATD